MASLSIGEAHDTMKTLPLILTLTVASSALASPQFFTTNTESDAGTTTCITWTFLDGSVTTITAPGPGTATVTPTITATAWN
ncbi:hypothetical protein E1B28_003693 [Marasmius oreades]|uniref:Uncharacterized protein n=1 Tax=Marasmius oreades TaxID=181124 RepID=A0A9P7UX27_9AGAR|nr:uncharacterized protein E1B28_003693 [Marasmius oreades]KAG7096244.1 hypothetical protein E1B28_003693 [Marasmius oreades]